MADNVTANAGSGGAVFATDDIGGIHYPITKITVGALESQTLLTGGTGTANAGCIRVVVASDNTVTVDGSAVTQPISASSLPLPTGAATSANQLPDGHNVTIDNAAGAAAVNIQDGGNVITVDGTVTANAGTGTMAISAASLPLPAGAATSANQTTHTTALQLIDNMIVAHDAAITGASGLSAIGLNARSTAPTAVQDGDAVRAMATLLGKQVALPYAIPASTWQYASVSGGITDTADDVAKAAAGAGVRNYVTSCQVINAHATQGTEVVIKDGSTVIWRGWAEPTGGGCAARFDPPLRGTANTAINVTNITTGATYFNLQGFVAAE